MLNNITVQDTGGGNVTVSGELPSGRLVRVDIHKPHLAYGGELQPSGVNWPGIGSVPTADAEGFAQLLSRAAYEAGRLDAEHGFLD